MKKEFLTVVLESIVVKYDIEKKLHLLDINFKIPVILENEKGSENGTQISIKPVKSGRKKKNQLTSVRDYSTVTESSPTGGHSFLAETSYSLHMSIQFRSSNLWTAAYTPYQQELFDIICKLHDEEGLSFKKISDWLVENGYRTPRDKTFTHKHSWSIYTKKKRSIARFSREFESTITDISIKELG